MSDAAAANSLGDALAALDRRDYATAHRLFEALGRKEAAEAIQDALAALDRKDYAAAQGLFEALSLKGVGAARVKGSAPATPAPAKLAAPPAAPTASDSRDKQKPATSSLEIISLEEAARRRSTPRAEKTKARHLKPLLLGCSLVLLAIFGASAIYGSPQNWAFATMKSQAIRGLASAKGQAITGLAAAVHVLKTPLEAITGSSEREQERAAMRDVRAALTQTTIRLDQIEHDYGARLDKLSERIDQDFPPDSPILRRGSIDWRKNPPRRRLPPKFPMSWRGSIKLRREPPPRLRLAPNWPTSRRGSPSWRREPPRSRPLARPSPFRRPRQDNRRLRPGRLPPRTR